MSKLRVARVRALEPDRIVGLWWCPVCGRAAHRYARPGRPRVYCSNACRQRAYRWRRDDRPQLPESELHTFRRGHGSDKAHAVRPSPDPVASRKDVRGREVTVCGAFALPARRPTWHHTDFVPDVRRSCRSCAALTDRWRGATYT